MTWQIKIPATAMSFFTEGEEVTVYTYLSHSENNMSLYGFYSTCQKEMFLNLIKVDGIGPAAALKILSLNSVELLTQTIESGDAKKLSSIQGIGAKTAAKIILKLQGTLSVSSDETTPALADSFARDLCEGLVAMGFVKKDCEKVVAEILKDDSYSKNPREHEKEIFKKAILKLSSSF